MDRQEIGLYLSATVRQRGLPTDYFVENNLKSRPFRFSSFPAYQLIRINRNQSVHCNWLKVRLANSTENRYESKQVCQKAKEKLYGVDFNIFDMNCVIF